MAIPVSHEIENDYESDLECVEEPVNRSTYSTSVTHLHHFNQIIQSPEPGECSGEDGSGLENERDEPELHSNEIMENMYGNTSSECSVDDQNNSVRYIISGGEDLATCDIDGDEMMEAWISQNRKWIDLHYK